MWLIGRLHCVVSLVVCISVMLLGCKSAIPKHHWSTDEAALQVLAQRAAAVQTIEASCSILLRDAIGESVALDGALAARLPDHLRIRAWKLHHAALDLTVTPEGVWVNSPQDQGIGDSSGFDRELRQAWALVSGSFLKRELHVVNRNAGESTMTLGERNPSQDEAPILCIVDVQTLTPRRYEMPNDDRELLYAIHLDRYRQFGEILWPQRIVFESRAGTMTIDLQDPEFNGEPASQAFTPPRDAVMIEGP